MVCLKSVGFGVGFFSGKISRYFFNAVTTFCLQQSKTGKDCMKLVQGTVGVAHCTVILLVFQLF